MRALIILLLSGLPAMADAVAVPSGQDVEFIELIRDDDGAVAGMWRFRFLTPAIAKDGGQVDADTAFADMQAVCDQFIAPALAAKRVAPGQIVVSFSDRPVVFGETNPEATQYFEAFSLKGDTCVWEGF